MPSCELVVLMYHALADAEASRGNPDPHYVVRRSAFRRHISLVRGRGLRISSLAAVVAGRDGDRAVAFTFDDGHESNAEAAIDILSAGGSADLFINPATVGKSGYLDWSGLADLAAAGISIQSHGQTHSYFDELSEEQVEYQLSASKHEIESRLGRPVLLFAPPGGRFSPRTAAIARHLGYLGVCSSRVGVWRGDISRPIPRIAVLASTTESQIERWISLDGWEIARLQARCRILAGAKRLLGNHIYDQLRERLLGWRARAGRA